MTFSWLHGLQLFQNPSFSIKHPSHFRHVSHGGFVDPSTEEDASDGDELEQLFPAEVIPVGSDHFMPSLQLGNGLPFGVVC